MTLAGAPSPAAEPLPFDVEEGHIGARRPAAPPGSPRWLAELPPVRRLLTSPRVQRVVSAGLLARQVREPARFLANELRGARGVRGYRLRASDQPVLLRHGTVDVWTFAEIFHLGLYEPPPRVAAALPAGALRAVDLGANIGLYGAFLLARRPGSRILAYEPDPANAAIHRRLIERTQRAGEWRLVEACAGVRDGEVAFLAGRDADAMVMGPGRPDAIGRPVVDVLPELADADLLKLDIEGAEWELLADPRLAGPRAIVMEYHPTGCLGPDPHAAADALLAERGYEAIGIYRGEDGVGMVWALSSSSGRRKTSAAES